MLPSDSFESYSRRIDTGQARSKAAPKRVYLKCFDAAPSQILYAYGAIDAEAARGAVSLATSRSSSSSSVVLPVSSDGAATQDRTAAVSGAKDESSVSPSPKVSASTASTSPPEVVSEASAVSRASI